MSRSSTPFSKTLFRIVPTTRFFPVVFILSLLIFFTFPTITNSRKIMAQEALSNVCISAVGEVSEVEKKQLGCGDTPSKGYVSVGGGSPPGPCQSAPPPPSDVKSAIINKWGITLNLPINQVQLAWQEFHEIDCTGFLQAIRGTRVESWGYGYAQQSSCPQDGEVDVWFSNQWGGEYMKAILVHELTHVWQFCSEKGEQNRLEIPDAYNREGGLTNYSRTSCGFDVNLYNEDHADTIALYLNPNVGELTCGNGAPNPFSGGNYPLHRGVAQRGTGR